MSSRAEPLYFGPQERPLFGWLHRAADRSHSIGLVICNPLGYESVCAHRSIKHFANAAASASIPALRFDYDGTGDSAGTDFDSDRLNAWLTSIHLAIDTLKQQTGVNRVCLLGIRMGATLASKAAADREDVVGLIAIAPVVSARAYLRELRALSLARAGNEATAQDDVLEAAGFSLTAGTREALNTLDITKLPRAPEHVLLIERSDLASNSALLRYFSELPINLTTERLPGYVEMMLDSHDAIVPAEMVQAAVKWLSSLVDGEAQPAPPEKPGANASVIFASDGEAAVRESACFLDEDRLLFGVLSTPAKAQEPIRSLVMLVNSGAVHHIGPNRLYVALARKWAAHGVAVLRLDLSGIGDSATRPGAQENIVYSSCAGDDIALALAFIRRQFGDIPVHAMGLCSGGYHSFKSAVAGTHFRTVVCINPLTFNWREGQSLAFPEYRVAQDVMRYKTNAFRWESWKKLLTGGVDIPELAQVLVRRVIGASISRGKDIVRRMHIPLPNDLGTELSELGKRRINVLFVFADGEPGIDLLNNGGGSIVPRLQKRGLIGIEFVNGADHTFTSGAHRDHLNEVLTRHVLLAHSTCGESL
jgi:alpha-beta hydrolase superfamily lysophospholipase